VISSGIHWWCTRPTASASGLVIDQLHHDLRHGRDDRRPARWPTTAHSRPSFTTIVGVMLSIRLPGWCRSARPSRGRTCSFDLGGEIVHLVVQVTPVPGTCTLAPGRRSA
jgi:hypothetical protein